MYYANLYRLDTTLLLLQHIGPFRLETNLLWMLRNINIKFCSLVSRVGHWTSSQAMISCSTFFLQEPEEGVIAYEDCGVKLTVLYHAKDLEGSIYPQAGDKACLYTFSFILTGQGDE